MQSPRAQSQLTLFAGSKERGRANGCGGAAGAAFVQSDDGRFVPFSSAPRLSNAPPRSFAGRRLLLPLLPLLPLAAGAMPVGSCPRADDGRRISVDGWVGAGCSGSVGGGGGGG